MTDPNKIFLGGVAFVTTEEGLRNYLSKYGTVADVVIMKDKYTGRSRGFGFATFTEEEAATKALADTHTIDGRTVEVKNATPRGSNGIEGETNTAPVNAKKIFVGGLAPSVANAAFKEYFEKYGQVEDAIVMTDRETERSRGFGFITFATAEAVTAAMADSNHELEGKVVEVKSAHAKQKDGPGYGGRGGRYGRGRGRGGRGRGGRGRGFAGFAGRGYGRGYPNGGGYEHYNGGRGGAVGSGYAGYGYGGYGGQGGNWMPGMYGAGYDQYKGYNYGGAVYSQQMGMYPGAGFPGGQGEGAIGADGQPYEAGMQSGSPTNSATGASENASDWIECHDPQSGRAYYANQKTRQTSWNRPEGFGTSAAAAAAGAESTQNGTAAGERQPQQAAETPEAPASDAATAAAEEAAS